jgi:2-polyprenyl-3-methyl-5-hydroxy-6-metoxy-1,4-benzoquinol methylase
MKREFNPEETELMDRSQPVSPELENDLRNLRHLNCYFGSYGLIRAFLRCWLKPGGTYRILDVATGSGDIPRMMVDWARKRSISVKIDAVDLQPSTLEIARRLSEGYPEINFIRGDVRTFEEQFTYDFVHCSLALHHFSDSDAVRLLRRMRALSHDKILVSDLERSHFTQLAVWLVTSTVFRQPMTVHDARLSVRRAFSFGEMEALAHEAGWSNFRHRRFFPARQALWLRVEDLAPIPLNPALDFAV